MDTDRPISGKQLEPEENLKRSRKPFRNVVSGAISLEAVATLALSTLDSELIINLREKMMLLHEEK